MKRKFSDLLQLAPAMFSGILPAFHWHLSGSRMDPSKHCEPIVCQGMFQDFLSIHPALRGNCARGTWMSLVDRELKLPIVPSCDDHLPLMDWSNMEQPGGMENRQKSTYET